MQVCKYEEVGRREGYRKSVFLFPFFPPPMPHYLAMNGEITGVQGVNHTRPCQWIIFSVDGGMGRRLTDHGTLERKKNRRRETERENYLASKLSF